MAIVNIPTEYRKPAMSTMGYFAQSMQPLLNMWMQSKMQEGAWKKRFDTQQEANMGREQRTAERAGWKPIDYMQEPGESWSQQPDVTIGRKGYRKPQAQLIPTKDGGRVFMYGGKAQYIAPIKASDFDKKLSLLAASYGGLDKVPRNELNKAVGAYVTPIKEKTSPSLIQQYNLSKEQGYKKTFLEWKKEVAKAGASNISMGERKLKAREAITAANIRPELLKNKHDKDFYMGNRALFHLTNKENEVAYLRKEKTWTGKTREVVEIMRLPKRALDNDWTSERVHEEAILSGMSMRDFLIKVLKVPVK